MEFSEVTQPPHLVATYPGFPNEIAGRRQWRSAGRARVYRVSLVNTTNSRPSWLWDLLLPRMEYTTMRMACGSDAVLSHNRSPRWIPFGVHHTRTNISSYACAP